MSKPIIYGSQNYNSTEEVNEPEEEVEKKDEVVDFVPTFIKIDEADKAAQETSKLLNSMYGGLTEPTKKERVPIEVYFDQMTPLGEV